MAEQESASWGLLSRIVVAAIAAMVLSLALKPYESQLAPYVKRIKNSAIANVNFDPSTSGKRAQGSKPVELVPEKDLLPEKIEKPRDKITEKDKSQLKSVLEKL